MNTSLQSQIIALLKQGVPRLEIASRLGTTPAYIRKACSKARTRGIDIPAGYGSQPKKRGPASDSIIGRVIALLDQGRSRDEAAETLDVHPNRVTYSIYYATHHYGWIVPESAKPTWKRRLPKAPKPPRVPQARRTAPDPDTLSGKLWELVIVQGVTVPEAARLLNVDRHTAANRLWAARQRYGNPPLPKATRGPWKVPPKVVINLPAGIKLPPRYWNIEDDYVPPVYVAKQRRCLRCSGSFQSSWSGERICETCRRSGDWQAGGNHCTAHSPSRRS